MLEHVGHFVIEFLLIFLGIAGKRLGGVSAPQQFLGLRIEDINYERADRDVLHGCSRKSIAAEAASKPATAQPIVEGLELLLLFGGAKGCDAGLPAR